MVFHLVSMALQITNTWQEDQCEVQSVTSRPETSRYQDFSHVFESIGMSLENFGIEKSLSFGLKNEVVSEFFVSKKSISIDLTTSFLNIYGYKGLRSVKHMSRDINHL